MTDLSDSAIIGSAIIKPLTEFEKEAPECVARCVWGDEGVL